MPDRLVYDGQWLLWNTPGDGEPAQKYRATSGMPGHQAIVDQCLKDTGPIPAGSYYFTLALDPRKYAKDDGSGSCRLVPSQRIQQIPRGTAAGECEPYWSNWGKNRVRIEPADSATRTACTPARSGFYIHDSTKGFSHGCIEVDPVFFNRLTRYAKKARGRRIVVEVKYAHTSTYGNTLK